MGEYLEKMLPEMRATENRRQVPPASELSSDENGHRYKDRPAVCKICKTDFNSRTYYFANSWSYCFDGGFCPDCRKKRADEIEANEKAIAKSQIERRRSEWRLKCGIPHRYQTREFANFDRSWQPTPYAQCLEYAENFPLKTPQGYRSLVLFSDHSWGTGKTHLACSIANYLINKYTGETRLCPVRFISEPVLFKNIRNTYSFTAAEKERLESEQEIINSLIRVPLLIVDDLGKEEVSDLRFVQRTLFAIIDGRYNAELPVVVTANLNDAGLKLHMGGNADNEASFSRLNEMCQGVFIRMDGKSYRDKIAGENNAIH